MNFNSILFVVYFLASFLGIFYLCPKRYRFLVLLSFSLIFYAYSSLFNLLLVIILATFNYFIGRYELKKKYLFYIGILINLGVLSLYKYYDGLLLPLGISFYTFNSLMYLIDIKNKKMRYESNYLYFLTFILMFPSISMGPLSNYQDFKYRVEELGGQLEDFSLGLRRFVFGLSVKCLIADNLASLYSNLKNLVNTSILSNFFILFVYALYLYLDFSSYSDMAIGLGKMIGLEFKENFNYPYCAKSVADFWRRWHMSLTSFFTKYIYIPLGGNRVDVFRHLLNILIVWLLTGIWHGSTINYLLWGLYYGLILILEKYLLKDLLNKLPNYLRSIYVLVIVLIGYIFFISKNLNEVVLFLSNIVNPVFINKQTLFYLKENLVLIILAVLLCLEPSNKIHYFINYDKKGQIIVDIVLIIFFVFSLISILSGNYSPFLYSAF